MATRAVSALFIDTNVLVYATTAQAPLHTAAAAAIQTWTQSGTDLWISRQVLREYLATLTRPQTYVHPLPVSVLVPAIQQFEQRFLVAEDSAQVTANLLLLIQQVPVGGKQIHDANLVATMQAYGIRTLLTHNVRDFVRFAPFITVLAL